MLDKTPTSSQLLYKQLLMLRFVYKAIIVKYCRTQYPAIKIKLANCSEPEGRTSCEINKTGTLPRNAIRSAVSPPAISKPAASFLGEAWYLHSLARAMSEVLTARESSMGSSGGTTEVRIKVHSRKSL